MIKAPTRDQQAAAAATRRSELAAAEAAFDELQAEIAAARSGSGQQSLAPSDRCDWAPDDGAGGRICRSTATPANASSGKPARDRRRRSAFVPGAIGQAAAFDGARDRRRRRRGRLRLLRQVHALGLDLSASSDTGTRARPGWPSRPTPTATACNWPTASCRSTWSSAGSTTRCASRPSEPLRDRPLAARRW